jgi:hypothetical protein
LTRTDKKLICFGISFRRQTISHFLIIILIIMQNNPRYNTPYCGTCRNAGKSRAEYTNHWTRSEPGPGGTITCPLILNTTCVTCNKKGHWAKYCTGIPVPSPSPPISKTNSPRSWSNVLLSPAPTRIIRPPSPDYPPPTYTFKGVYIRPSSPDYPPPSNNLD